MDAKPLALFAASAVLVLAGFAGVVTAFNSYETWQAESFGDRRLERPLAQECEIARVLLSDRGDPERAALLRTLPADRKLALRAFAWRSNGPRAGRGADWRKCRGLGRFVRGLGMARLASGEEGAAIYLSRATLSGGGDRAGVWETVYGPTAGYAAEPDRPGLRTWRVTLERAAGGAWRVVGRTASDTP